MIANQKPSLNVVWMPWMLAAFLLGGMWVVVSILGYDGLYGQDAYAHLNYAIDIQQLWRDGKPLGTYQWPRLYAFLGAIWPFGDPRGWMQFLVMAGTALSFAMLVKILQKMISGSNWLPFLTLAFVGFSPLLMRNSLSIMADAPALGAMLTAIWFGMCFEESRKMSHFLAAAFFAGFAVMLRYPVALALFFPILHWVWMAFRRKSWWGLLLFLPCFLVAALPQLLLPNAVGEGLSQPFQHQHFLQWSPQNYFGNSFFQKDGYNRYPVFNLGAALGPFWHPRYFGLGVLAAFGLIFYRKFKLAVPSWWILGAIAVNVLFLAGIPFQNPRFLLPVLPFVAVLFAPIWVYVWDRLTFSPNVKKIAFVVVLFTQMALCWWSCRLIFDINANEREIAATLTNIPNKGQRLYELSFEAMLKARKVPLQEVNMWYGPLPEPRVGDLVLFNLTAFEKQFAGMWPMKNWEMLQAHHLLKLENEWKEGWKLYVIE